METRNGQTPVDMLTRHGIPLELGDREFRIRPRTMKGDKAWLAEVEKFVAERISLLDNPDPIPTIIAALGDSAEDMLTLIVSYDETQQLPPREWLEENVYTAQITTAFTTLLEEAYPPFAISRRLLPKDRAAGIIGSLIEWVLGNVLKVMTSPPSEPLSLPSKPSASEPSKKSRKPGATASSRS